MAISISGSYSSPFSLSLDSLSSMAKTTVSNAGSKDGGGDFGCMDEMQKVFSKFDKNGDGKISFSELRDALCELGSKTSCEEVRRIMTELDTDGDGYVDIKEFTEFHQSGSDGNREPCGNKDLRDAFDLYDMDKNGLISVNELHSVLKRLGEKCSLSDCHKMIKSVDIDGDGHVNFEEFKKMMAR